MYNRNDEAMVFILVDGFDRSVLMDAVKAFDAPNWELFPGDAYTDTSQSSYRGLSTKLQKRVCFTNNVALMFRALFTVRYEYRNARQQIDIWKLLAFAFGTSHDFIERLVRTLGKARQRHLVNLPSNGGEDEAISPYTGEKSAVATAVDAWMSRSVQWHAKPYSTANLQDKLETFFRDAKAAASPDTKLESSPTSNPMKRPLELLGGGGQLKAEDSPKRYKFNTFSGTHHLPGRHIPGRPYRREPSFGNPASKTSHSVRPRTNFPASDPNPKRRSTFTTWQGSGSEDMRRFSSSTCATSFRLEDSKSEDVTMSCTTQVNAMGTDGATGRTGPDKAFARDMLDSNPSAAKFERRDAPARDSESTTKAVEDKGEGDGQRTTTATSTTRPSQTELQELITRLQEDMRTLETLFVEKDEMFFAFEVSQEAEMSQLKKQNAELSAIVQPQMSQEAQISELKKQVTELSEYIKQHRSQQDEISELRNQVAELTASAKRVATLEAEMSELRASVELLTSSFPVVVEGLSGVADIMTWAKNTTGRKTTPSGSAG